jgi:hypothetical protein
MVVTRALDEEERFRDERAEQQRERDRQREPRTLTPRARLDLRDRRAFQAGVIDSVNEALLPATGARR